MATEEKKALNHASVKQGPLPLVIGITGHRDLREEDRAGLEAAVKAVFEEVQEHYPHTPVTLLSPLAEGADQLAARVALQCDARLIVPLPMSREAYEQDFERPEARKAFTDLLQQAEFWFELPNLDGNSTEAICEPGECRNRQYASVGAYIAMHSQILIALWDGVDSDPATGGTAQIVEFRLNGIPMEYVPHQSLIEEEEAGPVCHIVTPRVQNPQPKGVPFERRELLPPNRVAMLTRHEAEDHEANEKTHNLIYDRMEGFNRDAVETEATLAEGRKQSEGYFFGTRKDVSPVVIPDLPAPVQMALANYSVADALSIQFAGLTSKMTQFVFRAMLVAALCFNLFHSLSGGAEHGGGEHGEGGHTVAALPQGFPFTAAEAEEETSHGAGGHTTPAAQSGAPGHSAPVKHEGSAPSTHETKVGESHAAGGHVAAGHAASAEHRGATGHDGATSETGASHGGSAEQGATALGEASENGIAAILGPITRFLQGPWFLAIYLGLVGAIFLRHRRVQNNDYQNKYQDYRALAEGLRIQLFWRLAGLDDSVANYYLGEQKGELEWIRNALRTWHIALNAKNQSEGSQVAQGVKIAQEYWIRAQKDYFARKARQEQKELEHSERRIQGLLRLSFILTGVLAVFLLIAGFEKAFSLAIPEWLLTTTEIIENHWVHGFTMIAILMLAVGAGLLHGYTEQRAYAEHAKQYGRMSMLFDIADRRLNALLAAGKPQEVQTLLRELGKEALAENGDWVLLHRERPLEVPQAG